MIKSEQINDLAAALSKAQGELTDAPYDSTNPFYNNKYASLSSYLTLIRPILSKYGLSITQVHDELNIETLLMHSSGQYIGGKIKLILSKQDMQQFGAATTYARRQAVQALVGISADDDDDGNSVVETKKGEVKPMLKSIPNVANTAVIGTTELNDLYVAGKAAAWSSEQVNAIGMAKYKIESIRDLTITQFAEYIKHLRTKPAPPK
jgi:hypothetical protein